MGRGMHNDGIRCRSAGRVVSGPIGWISSGILGRVISRVHGGILSRVARQILSSYSRLWCGIICGIGRWTRGGILSGLESRIASGI